MKLLVLGGTRFLGRHVVEAALRRGHAVTTFTRGNAPVSANRAVVPLAGNRDPEIAPGLAALAHGEWDAVVDTSGFVPRIVDASAALLADRIGRYLFVSSISVYANSDRPGIDESGEVAELSDPSTEEILPNYGGLKAACEAVIRDLFDARATIVRPGLIVGPGDASERFGYWVARFMLPDLLGVRGARAVVPAPPGRPIQLVDVRDLAAWMVDLLERDRDGTFNAACPVGHWTFGDLVDTLVGAARSSPPQPVWVPDEALLECKIQPWIELPLWLPGTEPDAAGFMSIDCTRAAAAGLAIRALAETVQDTCGWLEALEVDPVWLHVLSAERERAVLEKAGA